MSAVTPLTADIGRVFWGMGDDGVGGIVADPDMQEVTRIPVSSRASSEIKRPGRSRFPGFSRLVGEEKSSWRYPG